MAEKFWSPSPINRWRGLLVTGITKDRLGEQHYSFVSNLGYSLQYLEYLEHQIRETPLHATIKSQTTKTFVVVSMAVVESVLFYVLHSKSELPSNEWETIKRELTSPEFIDGDKKKRILTTLQEKLDNPQPRELTLDPMIKRVEKKKLLGIDGKIYKNLNYLRKLRNKVHIHGVESRFDTDWNAFGDNEFQQSKNVLLAVLTSEQFKASNNGLLSFLE